MRMQFKGVELRVPYAFANEMIAHCDLRRALSGGVGSRLIRLRGNAQIRLRRFPSSRKLRLRVFVRH